MSYLINTLLHPLSIFLGVLLILIGVIGGVGYYFNNKIKEQNLKIDSIASVVSTMAMEVRFMRGGCDLPTRNPNDKYINLNTSNIDNDLINTNSLINVSDSDESNSSEDESEDSYESESDGYETDDSEETAGEDNEDDKHKNNTKILQHNYESLNIDENIVVLKIDTPFFNIEDVCQNLNTDYVETIQDENEEAPAHNEVNNEIELQEEPLIENLEFININVTNQPFLESEEVSQNNTIDLDKDNVEVLLKSVEVDYKKMTLNKLKEIALEKGLIDESTKLKKLK
jgi:hypothetical protein